MQRVASQFLQKATSETNSEQTLQRLIRDFLQRRI